MKRSMTTVRGVDEEVLRKFKARTVEERMKMGQSLTQAMRVWMREREGGEKMNPGLLLKIKPFCAGKKKVRWSEEVDETIYGLEK